MPTLLAMPLHYYHSPAYVDCSPRFCELIFSEQYEKQWNPRDNNGKAFKDLNEDWKYYHKIVKAATRHWWEKFGQEYQSQWETSGPSLFNQQDFERRQPHLTTAAVLLVQWIHRSPKPLSTAVLPLDQWLGKQGKSITKQPQEELEVPATWLQIVGRYPGSLELQFAELQLEP